MSDDPLPSGTRGAASVDIADPGGRLPEQPTRWLRDRLAAALTHLGLTGRVEVRLVGDAEMAAAHERFGGVPGTTDVLTFDLRGTPEGPLDADLVLCVDEARRQSGQRRHPVEAELLLYALHGVLHCLGEDDHAEDAAERMHDREDEVLTAIGVGPVFAERAEGGS
ncbi:MAG: rRNA maturation RNase YbeY [Phycisphaerales bacterium]